MAYSSIVTHSAIGLGATFRHEGATSWVNIVVLGERESENLSITVFPTGDAAEKFRRVADAINEIFAEPRSEISDAPDEATAA